MNTVELASGSPTTGAALDVYRRAVAAGSSVLVRPTAGYEGIDTVTGHLAALSSRPLLVTDLEGITREVAAAPGPDALDAPLLAFHTSGSTGRPKCVVYRRAVVERHARTIAAALRLREEALAYVALAPPRFAYGLSIVHSHDAAGVPVTFAAAEQGLPGVAAVTGEQAADLAVYALPQHTPLLLGARLDPGRVRRIIVAGGRLSGAAARSLGARFPRADLTNMYGQAELGPRLSTWRGPLEEFVEGSVGHALPGVELQVRRRGEAEHADEVGEIHARTPFAMWRHIRPPYDAVEPGPEGFVRTGDRGVLLPDGQLRHEGRADHVINVAGTKVDAQVVRALVEKAFSPLVVRVGARPARVGGDDVPVVELVPGARPVRVGDVRRVLHTEFGSLAGLCDVRVVDRLDLGESGK